MLAEFFVQLSVIILVALILGLIARFFRQPLILAYVITGIILGPSFFGIIEEASLNLFAQIGIALLLFIVGISLDPKHLKEISVITGIGQVVFTSLLGFFASYLLGFNFIEALYISIALTFSSTIIVVKLLTDKGDIESLHGRISIGILLIQDLIVIAALIVISGLNNDNNNISSMIIVALIKGLILIAGLYFIYRIIIKPILNSVAKTSELLLLMSIALCFGIAAITIKFGFSLEIGAFLAGLLLANSEFGIDISAKIRPLRDFFIAIFFINLGFVMVFDSIKEFIWPIILLSLFVLLLKPLIIFTFMALIGYRSRTSLLTGIALAQISEFSLIFISLGFNLGYVTKDIVVVVTAVGIITITVSTYLINYEHKIFNLISKYLKLFERKNLKENLEHKKLRENYEVILFGCHRMGFNIINRLKNHKLLVIDHDPEVIEKLKRRSIKAIYADVNDKEIIDELTVLKPKFIVSTVIDIESNKLIIRSFKRHNPKVIIFATCKNTRNCLELYKEGSDFVAYPEVLAGQKIADYLLNLDGQGIKKWGKIYREKIIDDLREGNIVF